jgi:hypothetical protein
LSAAIAEVHERRDGQVMARFQSGDIGWRAAAGILLTAGALIACQPRVQVEAPKEPITINLNIKLDADVRVRLEERAKEDIQRNPGIF